MLTYWPPFDILRPHAQEFGLQSNTRVFTSVFTKATQTQEQPGALWTCTYDYPLLDNSQAQALKAFLAKLRGQSNRFWARDFGYGGQVIAGTASASRGGNTAVLSIGVTVSAGDYISIGEELKMIVADSAGTTVTVEPPFREDHTGSTINLEDPVVRMVLNTDSVKWNTVSPVISSLSFAATEAFE